MRLMNEIDFKDKKVLMRIDTDIELEGEKVKEPFRLENSIPDIQKILSAGAKQIFLVGHLGRPFENIDAEYSRSTQGGPEGEERDEFSLLPVAKKFAQLLEIENANFTIWTTPQGFKTFRLSPKIFLLENIRFYKGEESNNPEFAKKLASLADIFINDAVATLHRTHASIVGVPKYLPSYLGTSTRTEIERIQKIMENPKRPFVVVIGGAKIEDKKPAINYLVKIADKILVGGKVANDLIDEGYQNEKVILPRDFSTPDRLDIGFKTITQFKQIIENAKTIFWNGNLGKTEEEEYRLGSEQIAHTIVIADAERIVAGGDTVAFLSEIGLVDKFDYVCAGGGAILELLAGEKLPGLEAIEDNEK